MWWLTSVTFKAEAKGLLFEANLGYMDNSRAASATGWIPHLEYLPPQVQTTKLKQKRQLKESSTTTANKKKIPPRLLETRSLWDQSISGFIVSGGSRERSGPLFRSLACSPVTPASAFRWPTCLLSSLLTLRRDDNEFIAHLSSPGCSHFKMLA